MHKKLIVILVIVGVVAVSGVLLTTGIVIGRAVTGSGELSATRVPGYGMMYGAGAQNMMGGYNGRGMSLAPAPRAGVGGYFSNAPASSTPLTLDQAKQAIDAYLQGLNNPDLFLKEIMVFDNNAYARVVEKSTGVGAMELLVDPASLSVFPEYGPNMMWNLKYSPMVYSTGISGSQSRGMMGGGAGGMMGGRAGMGGYTRSTQGNPPSVSAAMPVTPDQAVAAAQQFIDQQFPGSKADPNPDAFYGYYTIDILKNDQPTGMLSVNGFNQQVFLHTWHGNFIEASEY